MTLDDLSPELAYLLPRDAMVDAELERRRLNLQRSTLASLRTDPYGFVMSQYPWGEHGALENFSGPDTWQKEALIEIGEATQARNFNGRDPVLPVRWTVASGHGVGKSAMAAWIVDWLMLTWPMARGTVTANTNSQLETKTWAAIQRWTKLCRAYNQDEFSLNSSAFYSISHRDSWLCSAQTSREENSESFAGQHNISSASFFLFDESSAISDIIWDVADAGLTDGLPFFFAFGNPTRSKGKFWRINFGDDAKRWMHRSLDSRNCAFPNKRLIDEWIQDYGEDSDFVRVRVMGLPPKADELQYIDSDRVIEAQKRITLPLSDEPLVAGLDVSGGGRSWNVFAFRRGPDARTIAPVKLNGEVGRDVVIAKAAEILSEKGARKVAALFVDAGVFGSPIAERLKAMNFNNVFEVNFGDEKTPDPNCLNMRSYMWSAMKDWLLVGAILKSSQLEIDLTGPGFHLNKKNQLVLESKDSMAKRGLASPDEADALALTFTRRVAPPPATAPPRPPPARGGSMGWLR